MIDRIDDALIQTNTEIDIVDGKTIVRVGYWPLRAAHGDQHARDHNGNGNDNVRGHLSASGFRR
jgi:hypothetical protein